MTIDSGMLIAIASIFSVLLAAAVLVLRLQSRLDAKLDTAAHERICEQRDVALKEDLTEIKDAVREIGKKSDTREEEAGEFRSAIRHDLAAMSTKIALLERYGARTNRRTKGGQS